MTLGSLFERSGIPFRLADPRVAGLPPAKPRLPRTTLRLLLFGLAFLVPLNLPFSIPPVGDSSVLGWSTEAHMHGGEEVPVVTRTMRHARTAGLLPGDELLRVNGQPADSLRLARLRGEVTAGDLVDLLVRRDGVLRRVRIVPRLPSQSFSTYLAFNLLIVVSSWLVGMALVAWRASERGALALAAALLLLAPATFNSGVLEHGIALDMARASWQLGAAGFRFFFPALLLHFLLIQTRVRLRSPWLWGIVYLVLLGLLATTTNQFRDPLAWTSLGPERTLRHLSGLGAELLLLVGAFSIRRQIRAAPSTLRWLMVVIVVFSATATLRSIVSLGVGERSGTEIVTQVNDLTVILVIVMAAIHFFVPAAGMARDYRRWIPRAASTVLTILYGVSVVGAAAIALNLTRTGLGGAEWVLFGAIFTATILFSPIPRWARDLVDARLWAGWIQRAEWARAFAQSLGSELEPGRISDRVAAEVPELTGANSARLILTSETIEKWGIPALPELDLLPAAEIEGRQTASNSPSDGSRHIQIRGSDNALLGALELAPAEDRAAAADPSEEGLLKLIASGIEAALRNTEAYLALRATEHELAEVERIASLGALAGGLAHEIKNPLASLKMGLHLLDRDGGVDPDRLARLEHDVRRMDTLISDLLRFTSDGKVETPEDVDLRVLVEECVEDVQAQARDRAVDLIARYPRHPTVTRGGKAQLRMIVSNVVRNALDAVSAGDLVEVVLRSTKGQAEVTVRDTGQGIPEHLRARIFDLSFTTKAGGTGLGLAIARREAERLGGTLELSRATDDGTSLRVLLPLFYS